MNQSNHELIYYDRSSKQGKEVLKKMYGSYWEYIISDENLQVSTPNASEYTLPQIKLENEAYVVREHPDLRYKLWEQEAPDVILLGSSIFFCDFNRATFFEKYPNNKILDFTTGNNTPFIAHYFMQRADSIGLKFKDKTIVIYGMNRVEMLEGYKNRQYHDFIKHVLNDVTPEKDAGQTIAEFLNIPQLRYDVDRTLKNKYDDVFRSENIYRKKIEDEYLKNEEVFREYLKSLIPEKQQPEQNFSKERIKEIEAIAHFLKERNSNLIILNMPQSIYNDHITNGLDFDKEMNKIEGDNIFYVDVSDHDEYNISQLDYIWPGNVFDPEHLNIDGADRFTESLIEKVVDSLLINKERN